MTERFSNRLLSTQPGIPVEVYPSWEPARRAARLSRQLADMFGVPVVWTWEPPGVLLLVSRGAAADNFGVSLIQRAGREKLAK